MKQYSSSPTSDNSPRLRVGLKDVSRAEFSDALTRQLGKQRITIMLDDAVIQAYKERSGGRGYQNLINKTLRDALRSQQVVDAA